MQFKYSTGANCVDCREHSLRELKIQKLIINLARYPVSRLKVRANPTIEFAHVHTILCTDLQELRKTLYCHVPSGQP